MTHWKAPLYIAGVVLASLVHTLHASMTASDWATSIVGAIIAGATAAGAYFDTTAGENKP